MAILCFIPTRSADGSCNNLRLPSSGQASESFLRLLPRKHSLSGYCAAPDANRLPNPRLVSRLAVKR